MYSRMHPYIPGVKIADQDTATIGAYHTSDVPCWFGIRPTRNWTAYDRELSTKMTDALITFAKTGDPNTAGVKWPAWGPGREQLVEFGNSVNVQGMNTPRLDFMAARGAPTATPLAARD